MARSWSSSQAECASAGGHLASLGHMDDQGRDLEHVLTSALGVSDWWSGGNICPDSPGI